MSGPLAWEPRHPPLIPRAVVGRGPVAYALLQLAAARTRDGDGLRVDVHDDSVILRHDDPPWVDGCVMYGLDRDIPGVWLPTARRPVVPGAWLGPALSGRANTPGATLLLREHPADVLVLAACWPASVDELDQLAAALSARPARAASPPGLTR